MRVSQALTAAVAVPLVAAAPSPSPRQANSTAAAAVGRLFSLNGEVSYFAGTNAWWLGHLTDDSLVDKSMNDIAASNEKIVRVWGFGNSNTNDSSSVWFQLINETLPGTKTAINYGSNGISRLDAVIAAAEKYGVGLVLPMINNWNDLGGINTYCNVFNCTATSFYTNTDAQAAYTSYVSFIVNRYKSSSAIFAWELGNEPRCKGCDSSVIYNWASEVSALIKSLDPTHLVTLGDEGWLCSGGDGSYAYSCAEGVDFAKNLEIATLDYGTFHLYPDSWGYNGSWGNQWIREHDAIGQAAGKPVVLEEYGIEEDRVATLSAWQSTVLDDTDVAADQFWQFGINETQSYGDIHSLYVGTEAYDVLATQHAAAMLAKPVNGTS